MTKASTLLSTRIKELRESENMTQQAFANEFQISKQTVSNYENNERTPDVYLLLHISKHFNVSMDYLTGNSDYKTPELKHIKDVTNIEISLIELISRMPDSSKSFLYRLLVENRETVYDFIEALILYRSEDCGDVRLTGPDANAKAKFFPKAILNSIVVQSLDELLDDILKKKREIEE